MPELSVLPLGRVRSIKHRYRGYLKLSSVKAVEADHYVQEASGTKGLIIDIRNHPYGAAPRNQVVRPAVSITGRANAGRSWCGTLKGRCFCEEQNPGRLYG